MSPQLDSIYEVARRSFLRAIRQPAAFVPAIVFPLFLVAVNSAGLDAATDLPGFPTDSYVTFALAIPFIQGGTFALLNTGTDVSTDVETGFMNRLAMTLNGQRRWRSATSQVLTGMQSKKGGQVGSCSQPEPQQLLK